MKNKKYDDFTEAFISFLVMNTIPVLEGGGEIGGYNPSYIDCEIKIKLNAHGGGYIHLLGRDSQTVDFLTMDHFRSQDMITPTQRQQISDLTAARATKIVRTENKKLKERVKELEASVNGAKEMVERLS